MPDYMSISELVGLARQQSCTIGQAVLADQARQMEQSEAEILNTMESELAVMERAAAEGAKRDIRSASGLTGGDGFRMHGYCAGGSALSGSFCAKAIATAISIAECNAAMGKIVAAPTAGSCGILPAAVLTMMQERKLSRKSTLMALICAGGIGMVIANVASISGAQGGCQAECGSASAMAAAALVELAGGTPDMVANAVAIALKNQLGLVCDPVAGLVEVPCIKRNAGGVMNAICAADMALAGIRSVIPVDEVITAMREVGDALPCALRETARGGLAATPTGVELALKMTEGKE